MPVTLIIDPAHADSVRHDMQAFLHFLARGRWTINEGEDFDGRVVLTIDFRDSLDADDFRRWRNMTRHLSQR